MDSHSNRVLITAIDSFTGSYVAKEFLNNGYEVYGTSQSKSSENVFKMNLTDKASIQNVIEKIRPNFIIHLGGISFVQHPNPLDFYSVNTIGTQNLLQALLPYQENIKKLVLASSATVYGNQDANVLDESMPSNPINHYGISKWAMEQVAKNFFEQLPIIITRPFNYTGRGQSENFVIPKIVKHFKEKRDIIELGNIDTHREYNDVRWVAEVYRQLAETEATNFVVNICSGKTHSIRDVLTICEEITSHKITVYQNPNFIRANEIHELKGNETQLIKLVKISENQIEKMVKWMVGE
ncbi:MAG: GDP-mannose 4,6-dehydratase [Chitinophagales bacterium]|nr:GDP-mannose 4,6-dehydratase [Chitinophagales bacterium]